MITTIDLQQSKNDVLRRSAFLALFIGSALTLANQFNALFGPESIQILPLLLVYLTPFMVITISQFTAIRQAWFDAEKGCSPGIREHLVAIMLSHGIPARAVMIGLLIGTLNSGIILTEVFLRTGDLGTTSIALLAQVYTLPILFGSFSQAVAYRRATKLIAE